MEPGFESSILVFGFYVDKRNPWKWTENPEAGMKLVRFGEPQREQPGVLTPAGDILDVSSFTGDYNAAFFEDDGIANLRAWLEARAKDLPIAPAGVRLGAPITRPGKIICVGLNYADHAKESNSQVPPEPVIFSKAVTAYNGPCDPIQVPRGSKKTDWEVELAFIIGRRSKYVAEADAMRHIAGFAVLNDVSEREFQAERCGQWVKGKSHDTFAPIGPWLVTPDEIENVQNLAMRLDVNGQRMQTGNTNTMVYPVVFLLSYISQFLTLEAGDVVGTGTPPGVGMGKKPPVFLKPGDVVELSVEHLGTQRQEVIAAD